MSAEESKVTRAGGGAFPATPWTMLMAARGDNTMAAYALGDICKMYWYPLYAFARRNGLAAHDAEDATQGFFAQLLHRDSLHRANREKGKLRTFLLSSMKYFMKQEWRKAHAAKRGGGKTVTSIDFSEAENRYADVPVTNETPETAFEREWAIAILDNTMKELRHEYRARGKNEIFNALNPFLSISSDQQTYDEIASKTGLTANAARVSVHRLRKRYRELLRSYVSATVEEEHDVDAEINNLFQALT